MRLQLLLFSAFLGLVSAQYCDDTNPDQEYLFYNPISGGKCYCDEHLWIADGCQEAFFCTGTGNEGCHLVSCAARTGTNRVSASFPLLREMQSNKEAPMCAKELHSMSQGLMLAAAASPSFRPAGKMKLLR